MIELIQKLRCASSISLIATLGIAAASALVPAGATAQAGPTRVEYDVEFTLRGSHLDPNCAASGTDNLVGTLTGFEPAPRNEPHVYVGRLKRTTRINICGERINPATGEGVVCSMSITGDDFPEVEFTVQPGLLSEGYLQYISDRTLYARLLATLPQPTIFYSTSVNGTCDPAEMAQMQTEYNKGQTAGSPSGQPIELAQPPWRVSMTFAATPPATIWALTIVRRRP